MNNHPFRFGDSRGTPVSDAKGGCCGKPIGCRIESKGCLHHAKKAKWQQEALDEMDRNARAYGWEIGRGKPMTRQMEMSPDNPFIQEDWKKNMVEPADLCPTCKETLPCTTCGEGL